MKFEEEFPSIKWTYEPGQRIASDFGDVRMYKVVEELGDWLKRRDVQEHCLDNQRVRKLVKDYILLNSLGYPTKLTPKEQFEKLYKELGL